MKHYALAMVSKVTGEIEHISTSGSPLADDRIGTPENAIVTHQLIRFEFDADPDNGSNIMRARTALSQFEMVGANAAAKSASNAIVKLKTGMTRAIDIVIGTKKP